ncbi:hypothetical protein [Sphingomonas quercus]|uniref:hypothetical protein n=1 Tax=Sphingomonas quercus TaxID=2842451 RepID=UPI003F4DC7D9
MIEENAAASAARTGSVLDEGDQPARGALGADRQGRYCFPLSERIGGRCRRRPSRRRFACSEFQQAEMSAHGFRAMAATLLNESGQFHPDAIERPLAHIETNGVRCARTRGEYWSERVMMMQYWSDELDRLHRSVKLCRRDSPQPTLSPIIRAR